jgi:hypothetical protein
MQPLLLLSALQLTTLPRSTQPCKPPTALLQVDKLNTETTKLTAERAQLMVQLEARTADLATTRETAARSQADLQGQVQLARQEASEAMTAKQQASSACTWPAVSEACSGRSGQDWTTLCNASCLPRAGLCVYVFHNVYHAACSYADVCWVLLRAQLETRLQVESARLVTVREQDERVIRDLQKEADDLHSRLRELTAENQQLSSKLQIQVGSMVHGGTTACCSTHSCRRWLVLDSPTMH